MEISTLAIAFLAALTGSLVATWTGFGAATILTPVLFLFLEPRQTILVVAIYHGLQNGLKLVTFRRDLVLPLLLLFGAPAVLCAPLGGLLSSAAPTATLRILLGAFLIFDGASGFLKQSSSGTSAAGSPFALAGGAFSGLAAGVIGTGGAVRALFLHRFLKGKEDYVATSAGIAFLIDASRVPVYVVQYPASALDRLGGVTLVTTIAGFAGVFLARAFLGNVSVEGFRHALRFALIGAGILFLAGGFGVGL